MAVSILYLDDHGEQVAKRVSDITYRTVYRPRNMNCIGKYWILHPSEKTLLFEIGSDKRDFEKYPEGERLITLYVRFRGYKKSGWYSPNYPERNTIYISPEENGLKQHEYYSLCYQEAEEKIRALAKLASTGDSYIPIDFSYFEECFSNAFFVDAFTIEKPDISHFAEAVNEMAARLNEKLSGFEKYNALFYFQLPDIITNAEYDKAMEAIEHSAANLKFKVGLGFNSSDNSSENTVSITAAISYRHPQRGASS